MLVKYFRYIIYLITITLLISSCSSNRAPVLKKSQYDENVKLKDTRTNSYRSLRDLSNDRLVSQVGDSFLPKNVGVILPFDSAYENISKILKLPLGTVKSRINRGKLKLREILHYLSVNL